MTTCTSTTFEVSKVARATDPLHEVPYRTAIANQLVKMPQSSTERPSRGQERTTAARRRPGSSIEACSDDRLLVGTALHPVLYSVTAAFHHHRPLCLSPDAVWLLICQGVANHINAHSERLRSHFVAHEGKMQISVRRDDFVLGSDHNPWEDVIDAFALQVGEHIGRAGELFVPRFSTTGPTERIVAQVVLLDAMQAFFTYGFMTSCGIPEITLEGTVEDWEQLAERTQKFAKYDLDWWLEPLQLILQEFIAAVKGDVRPAFWESICKHRGGSGGPYLTGWITAFFPYLKDGDGRYGRRNQLFEDSGTILDGLRAGEHVNWRLVTMESFPLGLSRAPFAWRYHDVDLDMEFLGGFVGAGQDTETLTLRPEIGWAVRSQR